MSKKTNHLFPRKIFGVLLLLILFFNFGLFVYSQIGAYLYQDFWQRFPALKQTYLSSQYVNKHPEGWVPDETINAYAGGAYIKGVPPILIAPDTPPAGRYMIGLSELLFNNENVIILISAILSLFFLFLLGTQLYSSWEIALITPVLITFEPFFKNQLIYKPLLDIMQLWEILGSFYFFNKGMSSKKNSLLFFLISNIFLGLFISTKFFATGITIVLAFIFVLAIAKSKDKLKKIVFMLPVAPLILLLSYVKVFSLGYSLKAFLGIQKWVFLYHKSQLILPFSIWPLLFLNKWFVWYGDKKIISDGQWQITWPIVGIITIATIVLYSLKKIPRNANLNVLVVWVILYILFFSFGQITTRYLVIYIPILYLISLYGIEKMLLNRYIFKRLSIPKK